MGGAVWIGFDLDQPDARFRVRSRFGSLRTLAASHHEGNRRIATLRTRHILGGIAQPAVSAR
jgi:hypothetical protein